MMVGQRFVGLIYEFELCNDKRIRISLQNIQSTDKIFKILIF